MCKKDISNVVYLFYLFNDKFYLILVNTLVLNKNKAYKINLTT